MTDNWIPPTSSMYKRVILYGPPGVGKTSSELTMPTPVRVVDPENSTLALEPFKDLIDLKVRYVSKWQHCIEARQELAEQKVEGGTIVFDTLTQIQKQHIREIAGANTPVWKNYYVDSYGLSRLYASFAALPMNVIYVCGQDTHKVGEGENQSLFWVPDLTPAVMRDLLQICDAVGYMYFDTRGDRCLTFQGTRTYYAKRRHPALPREVVMGTREIEGLGKVIDWQHILSLGR